MMAGFTPAVAFFPCYDKIKQRTTPKVAAPKVSKGDRRALWSPPQRRNPCVSGKAIYNGKEQLLGRAHLARQYASCGQSSLGARLRTRKVTGRDASLPAPLLAASLGSGRTRNSWGVAPNPTRELRPLTPQGTLSLDPFSAARLERFSHAVPFWGFLPFSLTGTRT